MYNFSSLFITGLLFLLIIIGNEGGFRLGRYIQYKTNDELRSLTGSLQASILGLLALLLGFTFSMSMQRYDSRNHALIDEATAISATLLRVQLLDNKYKAEVDQLLDDYIHLRLKVATIDLTQGELRREINAESKALQRELWLMAMQIAEHDPSPLTSGAFLTSLDKMIAAEEKRNALLQLHVPEVVLYLLFVVFISAVGIIGYSSGLTGKRIAAPTILIAFLISMIVFLIIDLDRPKRGLIQVDQSLMRELLLEVSQQMRTQ